MSVKGDQAKYLAEVGEALERNGLRLLYLDVNTLRVTFDVLPDVEIELRTRWTQLGDSLIDAVFDPAKRPANKP